MKKAILTLLVTLSISCQSQTKNIDMVASFKNIKEMLVNAKSVVGLKELVLSGKTISYNESDNTIIINTDFPSPSKVYDRDHHFLVKNSNDEITFWKGDFQVLKADKVYKKLVTRFISVSDSISSRFKQYNTSIRINENDEILFVDDLKIQLVFFSHKLVYEDQQSPAIAHFRISKDQGKEPADITLRRESYQDENNNIVTDYESDNWENYTIELKDLAYDEYVNIIVTKEIDTSLIKYTDITDQLSVDEFEEVKQFILKGKGTQSFRNYDNDNPHHAFIDFDMYLGADLGQHNIYNDPELSDFNELTIRKNDLMGDVTFKIIILREGDIKNNRAHIIDGMEEGHIYLVDIDKKGIDTLREKLTPFLKTIKERIKD